MSLKVDKVVKFDSDPCVLAWHNELFAGFEDGTIKGLDENLNVKTSWSAHGVQLFALAAGGGRVYSSSNDGAIRVWNTEGVKQVELPCPQADVLSLDLHGDILYTGDEVGNVVVYERDAVKASYDMLEEVKCLLFQAPFLYTVRDLYVYVTEIKPDEHKSRFTLRHTMEGRAPICFIGNKYLLVVNRTGNNLELHDASIETSFKKVHEVKVSDMIVTSVASCGDYVWTGGWDGRIRRWKLSSDQLIADGELNLDSCINAIVARPEAAFAAVTGGRLVKIMM